MQKKRLAAARGPLPAPPPRIGRLLAAAALAALLGACASTRDLPATTLGVAPALRGGLAGLPVNAEGLRADDVVVGGGHHEGLAQVRQPWIWDLSDEQRTALYGDLKDVARYAFLDELKRLGFKVSLAPERGAADEAKNAAKAGSAGGGLVLSGRLLRVELNTYGRGLSGRFEGFGSAGDYWEARVAFDDLQVVDRKRQEILWRGALEHYAKLPGSPAKLDYTHWDLLSNSLRVGLAGSNPGKLYDAVQQSKADYTLNRPRDNPVELAARRAARDLAARLQALPRFAAPPR